MEVRFASNDEVMKTARELMNKYRETFRKLAEYERQEREEKEDENHPWGP